MMTAHGTWLAAIAKRLLHQDTFEAMVSPAIADLQSETDHGWHLRARHYTGLVVVFGFALLRDIRVDAGLTSYGVAWHAWRKAVAWTVALTLPLIALALWVTPWHHLTGVRASVVVVLVLFFVLFGAPVSTIATAFYLRRGGLGETRTVIAALLIPVVLFAPAAITWGAFSSPVASRIYETAAPRISPTDEHVSARIWLSYVEQIARPEQQPTTVWGALNQVAAFPLSAMIGVLMARRRGWRVFLCWIGLQFAFAFFDLTRQILAWPVHLGPGWSEPIRLLPVVLVCVLVLRGNQGRSPSTDSF